MKKVVLLPVLLVAFSVISTVIYSSPYTYFNLFLSGAILCIALFTQREKVRNRIKYGALWFLLFELLATILLLCGENIYEAPAVWSMYAVIAFLDIFVTPMISKEK